MEDRLSPKEFYEYLRNESVEYLINKYEGEVVEDIEDKNWFPVTIKTKVEIENLNVLIYICLPFNYPDSFPRVRIAKESFNKLYPLPHLNQDGVFCIFDEVLASPNPDDPKGILDFTYKKTVELLTSGINGSNEIDYSEEFEAYWTEESLGSFLNLVRPNSHPEEVFLVPFKYSKWPFKGIISNNKTEALNWIHNVQGKVFDEKITKLLYVPLKKLPQFPFPKNNYDIYRLLKSQDLNTVVFTNFLTHNKRPTKILFSVSSINSYTWGIWEHNKPSAIDISLYKGFKNKRTELKGFRKGKQNGLLEITRDFPNVEIKKYSIIDIRNERLLFRGGSGNIENNNLKVAVIGCGAIGSHLVQGLVDININELLLVDPDILNFENVKRHLCGISDVGIHKTKAIRTRLLNHHPSLKIHTSESDILKLISLYPNILNNYDYIFVAISNFPVENRLRRLQINNQLKKPLSILWVEPYMAGGHAVYLHPNSKSDYKSYFNSEGEYDYHILRNGNQYAHKELGCNTSFVPYGVLELKKFLFDYITEFKKSIGKNNLDNRAYIWFGNLKEQRVNNRLLSHKWVGMKDYSTRNISLE